jgi:PAS domain S-box-containing protein
MRAKDASTGRLLRVLLVEDSSDDAELLRHALVKFGFEPELERVETGAEMERALQTREWDIVLADYSLPQFDAPSALQLLQRLEIDLPLLIVSGSIAEAASVSTLNSGAHDFIPKGNWARLGPAIRRELRDAERRADARRAETLWKESDERFETAFEFSPNAMAILDARGRFLEVNAAFAQLTGFQGEDVRGRTSGEIGLTTRREPSGVPLPSHSARWQRGELNVRTRAGELRTGICSVASVQFDRQRCLLVGFADITDRKAAEVALARSHAELSEAYDTTLTGWARALELRDAETQGHSARVTGLTVEMARLAGLGDDELVHVRRGALLHDIGKMAIPDAILLKPGALTDEEWVTMRRHPQYAYDMLLPIAFLAPALAIPLAHHERWDGAGYPHGLAGDAIPLPARLFAVVDVWDALCSVRPYKDAWPEDRVIAHIRTLSGTHFDPQAVLLFERALDRKEWAA